MIQRALKTFLIAIASPALFVSAAIALLATGLVARFRRRPLPADTKPDTAAASVVIPNWNGRDLLEKYLPSVVEALSGNPRNEIIVVDNASDDDSRDFLARQYPEVRVIALARNVGFGGGSNAGFRAAKNDIVVLLNSDMRVAPDFLAPLLATFEDELVFAASCQIFFSDANKAREETGLTVGWWHRGQLRVAHRTDDKIREAYPCFYGGGGSCAFDRRKFLELGGFDELLAPFYLEDTDLGYMAWKRGWKVMYQPLSRVWHEHRGTIGKKFTPDFIAGVLKTNYLLWTWKNIHHPGRVLAHLGATWTACLAAAIFGDTPLRPNFRAMLRAWLRLPAATRSRARAIELSAVDDAEAFRRPFGGFFRDRFHSIGENPDRPSVLFVAPYPIYPPIHGGAVFMYQTVLELARRVDLHLLVMLDWPRDFEPHQAINKYVASAEYVVRAGYAEPPFTLVQPHAVGEFGHPDYEWLIHRQIYLTRADVVQLEYTPMAQYAGPFRRIGSVVFEHDIYFQSIARALRHKGPLALATREGYEYFRTLRFEGKALERADRIQVCSRENGEYLASFFPGLRDRIDHRLRAGVDTSLYTYRRSGREPLTILFLGNFRHQPNIDALNWLIERVMPKVVERCPGTRLKLVGAEPPDGWSAPEHARAYVDFVGFVEDVREPLGRYSVFACPILSGSGVRVKLLEAFAAGIPAVSTTIGAEGLIVEGSEICALADDADAFAAKLVQILTDADYADGIARRAREYVVRERDIRVMTERLVDSYREVIAEKSAARSTMARPIPIATGSR